MAETACPAALQSPAVTEARASDRFGTNYAGSPEPIYGAMYLPRKFKVKRAPDLLARCTI